MTLGFPGPLDEATAASCDTRRISPVMARGGIIGAQHPLVSSAGLRVLATGGNAVDAAVAAALVATVVMPGRCGIGAISLPSSPTRMHLAPPRMGIFSPSTVVGSLPAAPRSSSCANVARNQQAAAA